MNMEVLKADRRGWKRDSGYLNFVRLEFSQETTQYLQPYHLAGHNGWDGSVPAYC